MELRKAISTVFSLLNRRSFISCHCHGSSQGDSVNSREVNGKKCFRFSAFLGASANDWIGFVLLSSITTLTKNLKFGSKCSLVWCLKWEYVEKIFHISFFMMGTQWWLEDYGKCFYLLQTYDCIYVVLVLCDWSIINLFKFSVIKVHDLNFNG